MIWGPAHVDIHFTCPGTLIASDTFAVFNRDKKPLLKLLDLEDQPNQLITFGDFAIKVKDFVQAIKGYQVNV